MTGDDNGTLDSRLSGDAAAIGKRKVPVEVAATGPKVIGIAVVHADRVMFAIGADPERIAWGMEVAIAAGGDAPARVH